MERSDGIYPLCFVLGAVRLALALATDETFGAEASIAAFLAMAGAVGWLGVRPDLYAVLMRRGGRPPASPQATPCNTPRH